MRSSSTRSRGLPDTATAGQQDHLGEGHRPPDRGIGRAANETTLTDWDPVSKQPLFKTAAASVRLYARGGGTPAPAPTTTASAPARPDGIPPTAGGAEAHATHAGDRQEDRS